MEEKLQIYDENHNPVGEASRTDAHREGLWHEVVHCWMVCSLGGRSWIYFQRRAFSKKDFPGLYDIASTGHIDAGESHREAVCREAFEETGVSIDTNRLTYLGIVKEEIREGDFFDREFAHVYLYELDIPGFAPGEEVEEMAAFPAEELIKMDSGKEVLLHGMDLSGNPLAVRREEFCNHPGEFTALVLPRLNIC